MHNANKQKGVSLIEALVALVVLSIGLLGVAFLVIRGLVSTNTADGHTLASLLANDMVERMHANPVGIADGNYNELTDVPSGTMCSLSCTPAQLAQLDMKQWRDRLSLTLPAGSGTVSGNGTGSIFTVTVQWFERVENQTKSFTVQVMP